MNITSERLLELLHYDPETGIFIRRFGRARDRVAGGINTGGHRQIRVDGRLYLAHRLAFLYMTGEWPKEECDHINLIKDDNRWSNLREATHSQNRANRHAYSSNTSNFKGVDWSYKKWRSRIQVGGDHIYLGMFDTAEEAHEAYKAAALKYFGAFARTV